MLRRMPALQVLLVAVATLTAGCVGLGGADPEAAADPASEGLGASGPASGAEGGSPADDDDPSWGGQMLALDGPAAHAEAFWVNGTWQLTEADYPVGDVMRTAGTAYDNVVYTDITDRVPMGIPTRIIAQADAAMAQGDLDLWLRIGANEWWTGDWDTPQGGYSRVEMVMVRVSPDPVLVALRYDDPEPAADVDYAMSIEVSYDPARFPVGPAYALDLTPGTEVRFTYEPRTGPGPQRPDSAVVLWDPRDEPVARLPFVVGVAEFALPREAMAGEYVVAFAQGRGDVRIEARGGDAPVEVRRLDAATTQGEPVELPLGQEEVTWTFDVQQPILLAGFFSANAQVLATKVRGFMESPAGVLFDFEAGDGTPFLFPGMGADSGYSPEALVPGTYTVTAGWGTAAGREPATFAHYLVGYQR